MMTNLNNSKDYLYAAAASGNAALIAVVNTAVKKEVYNPDPSRLIPFNQGDLIIALDPEKTPTLVKVATKFHGLCEIICNLALTERLLDPESNLSHLKEQITIDKLNETTIKQSHILEVYSIFQRAIAYLFQIYPDNLFSHSDQRILINKTAPLDEAVIDPIILAKGLATLQDGEEIKMCVFHKNGLSFSGHSLLIKKVSAATYIFFDPNQGMYKNLSFDELKCKIESQIQSYRNSEIFFTKADQYLERLRNKGWLFSWW